MSFLRRRAHRADTLLYGGVKKFGGGLLKKCGSVNVFCVNGMRDTAKHSSAKRKNRFTFTQLLFKQPFLVARREFIFFSGVCEQNLCLFLPTRRGDPFVKETLGGPLDKRTGEKKTTAGGGSVGPTFFIRSADSLCVCVGIGAMLLWFLKWYDDI